MRRLEERKKFGGYRCGERAGKTKKKGGEAVGGYRQRNVESRREEEKHEGKKEKEKRQSSSVFLSPAVTD